MNSLRLTLLIPLLFCFSWGLANSIPYTGKISIRGVNYHGDAQFRFSLHDGNGTTHWENGKYGETIKVSVQNGHYEVFLGGQGMNSLPAELFLNYDKLYLKVEVDMETGEGLRHLAPDQLITVTPRALVADIAKVAQVAEKVSNGAITRDMLNPDILDDLNATIEKSRLSPNILSDINRTITYDRLAPSAIHAISSASLSSITNGKIKIVPFGQTPPSGYSLYHRGKVENLNWKFTQSTTSPGDSFDRIVIYNNRVILMGRENGFQQYPVLSPWKNFYSVNNAIGGYSTVLLNDNVYLIGGHDGNSKSNRLRIFNLTNNSFTEGALSPLAGQHRTAQAIDGKIFETGGWKNGGGYKKTFSYDPILDEWTEKSPANFDRILSASVVYQNKMWIIGGENNSADKVESYDITNDTWTIEKSLLQGRKRASCWVFRDFLFVAGGKDVNGTILDSIECYDPRTESWYDWGQLPNPVSSCAAYVIGDMLHIFDGGGNNGVLSLDLKTSISNLNDIYIHDGNGSAVTPIVHAEVADGSVTTAKLDSTILKYLKPEITAQPQAQTVYADSNVSFSVTAEGKYLTYQWYKDGVDLAGETNATLNITDANATLHDGNYTVVVSNDFGSVESGKILIDVNTTWSTDGLVGWWKFDETNGTVAYDSSGNDNHGALSNGPTWAQGKIGGAISFDGADDVVNIGNPSELKIVGDLTLSLWLNPNQLSQRRSVVNKAYGGEFSLSFEPDSTSNFYFGTTGSHSGSIGSSYFASKTDPIPLNQWTNFMFTRDMNLKILTAFLNSTPIGTTSFSVNSATAGPNNISFGDGRLEPFSGLLDDIRIYDRALSAAEVQALYNLGQ